MPAAVLAATVIVGTAERALNEPDRVSPVAKDFEQKAQPRLSTSDTSLWDEFPYASSKNVALDPSRTVEKFQSLPTRSMAHTHEVGLDWLLLIPMHIGNVNPSRLVTVRGDEFENGDKLATRKILRYAKAYQERD